MKFAITSLIVFTILVFLKFCEDSPVRSWKTVFLTGIPFSFIVCFYLSHAFPKPSPRLSGAERIAANRAELERNFSHIADVKQASITDDQVALDFNRNKSSDELKRCALQVAGTTAYYLHLDKTNQIIVLMDINERPRYKLTYEAGVGIMDETEF